MAADGNTAPITAKAATEAPVSGEQPTIMPVIVQDATGAISRDSISTIGKPDTGTIRVIDTGNMPELNFSFAASDVKLTALDVDLVMIFKDNSKIILPSLALDLIGGNPPRLTFKGTVASPQAVVAQIGQTTLVDITPSVQLSSPDFLPKKKGGNTNDADQTSTGQNGIGGGEPPVPPQPVVSGAKTGRTGENDGAKTADFNAPPVEKVQPGTVGVTGSSSAIANPSIISTAKSEQTNTATAYAFDVPVTAKLYQIVDNSPAKCATAGGGQTIKGGSGVAPADTDSSFAAQSKAETLTGTSSADEIWADNPDYSSAGRAGRVISLTPSVVAGYSFSTLTISGIPDGYTILGVNPTGKDAAGHLVYQISAKAGSANEFQFQLAYTVPADANADKFSLSLSFVGLKTDTKSVTTVTSSVYVQVSDVHNDAEQITTNTSDGRSIINLSLLPAGNSISGAEGNDTIHAAAGADTIDGGTGDNWVYYDMSRLGVSVDLKSGIGHSGFAEGDTYANIHNIKGSTAADILIGDDFGDSIDGNGGKDSVQGGTGNDYFYSDGSGNSIDGGDGNDTLSFAASTTAITVDIGAGQAISADTATHDVIKNIEAIIGTKQDDEFLITGTSAIKIDAGGGNDTIVSGIGADTLDGGDGTDTISYINSTAAVSVDLGANQASGGYATGDVLVNFENAIGSNLNDTLIGSAGPNVLDGRDGDDSLNGGSGNDTLLGGAGNDTIQGGIGFNSINGGADNDLILAGPLSNTIDGGDGIDTVDYSNASGKFLLTLADSGNANVFFSGVNKVDTIANVENIIGTANDDTISGNSSDNSINGFGGNDILSGGRGNDTLDGGAGTNWVSYDDLGASDGPHTLRVAGSLALSAAVSATETDIVQNLENLIGSKGDDLIIGDERKNSLYGGDGNDTFIGGGGSDSIDGQGGINTVSYASKIINGVVSANTTGVSVDLFNSLGTGGLAIGDKYNNIQNVIGSDGNDSLRGDAQDNSLAGGIGDDTLDGGSGNDTLSGGFGNDLLKGGDGDDLIFAGTGTDTVYGNAGNDTLDASAGTSASLVGGDGDDSVFGSIGNDTISGGIGNNTLDGQAGTADMVDYSHLTDATQNFTLTRLTDTSFTVTAGSTGSDSLLNIEAIKLGSGINTVNLRDMSSVNMTIDGSSAATDSIATGAGNDSLLGGAGNDTFSAGYGTNTINGGSGTSDTIDYGFLNTASDVVSITATGAAAFSATGTGSGTVTDTITNVEAFVGSAGNDVMDMRNATGALTLYGGGGNDTFYSGKGNDVIDGGDGTGDTVDYSWAGTGHNVTLSMAVGATNTFIASNTTSGFIGTDTLINIESIKLTANGDSVDLSRATANLSLTSGGGGDTITTGAGNDYIDASASTANAVSLTGGNGNDTIIGGGQADKLMGGAGNDSIYGGPSADTIDGGDGVDIAGYDNYTSSVQISANNSTFFSVGLNNGTKNERLYNIEAIVGGSYNDTFDMTNVTTVNLSLFGGAGDDTFKSGGGNDTLAGGSGNDLYYVNSADDQIIEQADNGIDTVFASANFNLSSNGANVEQLYHRDYNGNYLTSAFTGSGNALDNYIAGGTGNDSLAGGGGNDTFYWTGGNDTVDGEGVPDSGTAGTNDAADFSAVGTNALSANLSLANRLDATQDSSGNWLVGILNAAGTWLNSVSLFNIENIIGTSGKDVFKLNEGNRALTIDGKGDTDTLSYEQLGVGTKVSVTLNGANAGAAVLSGTSNRTDTVNNIENVTGGAGNDTIIGDTNANVFMGRGGNDSIDGGSGVDTADYSYITTGTNGITVQLNANTAALVSFVSGDQDTIVNIENIIGTAKNDSIAGDIRYNSIFGGDGNDTLSGGSGNDTLDGGGNAVGSSDMVDFTYLAGKGKNLSIGLNTDGSWTSSVELTDIDTLRNFEAIKLAGATNTVDLSTITYAVTIDGSLGGSNSIATGSGNDSLLGGGGNDTFSGGGGNDTVDGGTGGTDLVDFGWVAAGKNVTVTAANATSWNYTDSNGASGQLLNIEAIKGSAGNDRFDLSALTATSAGYSVDGGAGNDTLIGSAGNDTLVDLTGNNFFDGGGTVNTSTANISGGGNSMAGGGGNDTYLSHSVNDKISDTGGSNTLQTDAFSSIDLNDTAAGTVGAMLSAVASANTKWTLQYVGTGNFTGIADDKGDSIYGANGNDLLTGGKGSDLLIGYYGNNTIDGGGLSTDGADTLVAYGNGNNVFVVRHAGDVVTIDDKGLGYGINTVSTVINNVDLSTSSGFTNLVYIGTGSFTGVGSADNNSIGGSSANDYIDGYLGNDTVRGGGGNDALIGGGGNDSLIGGTGNDTIDGGSENDTITGNGGNDILIGGTGSDNITGGTGNDIIYDGTGTETGETGAKDTLIGGGGNDIFFVMGIADSVQGGSSVDTIRTLLNAYTLAGGNQVDNLIYADKDGKIGSGNFTGVGNELNNTITGGSGNDSLSGGAGNDSIFGGDGNNTLSGGAGNDTLNGGNFGSYNVVDYSYVGAGIGLTVTLNYASTTVTVNSTTDIDRLTNYVGIIGGDGNDVFVGGDNNPHKFYGGKGNDSLLGSGSDSNGANYTSDDVLQGGIGNDTLDGGQGNDTADYSYVGDTTNLAAGGGALTTGLTVALNGASTVNATIATGSDVDQLRNIENIIGTQFADCISGDNNANSIFGGAGNDTINGGNGNALNGAIDSLDGGDGIDTFAITTSSNVSIQLGDGNSAGGMTASGTNNFTANLYNFENILTSGGADSITGNSSANLIDTGAGNDSIYGGGGSDTLIGNTGNDTIDGGAQSNAVVSYAYFSGSAGLSVVLSNTPFSALIAGNETDILSNIENIIGTKNNDTIFGDANANSLFGGLGNDCMSAGGGNDTMDGGDGVDTADYGYLNSSGTRGVSITLGSAATTFLVSVSGANSGQLINFETLQLSNYADSVNLAGATSNLSISAGTGADTIIGGSGNDTISGGADNDSLDGGGQTGDLLTYAYLSSSPGITLTLNGANAVTTSGSEADVIRNFENVIGSQNADNIAGDIAANSLSGGQGNDTLSGNTGNDTLDGGAGTDTLDYSYIANKTQTFSLVAQNNISWTANGGSSDSNGSANDIDTLSNFEALKLGASINSVSLASMTLAATVDGSLGAQNTIAGGQGSDSISGGDGADSLFGDAGNDTLRGGKGNDTIDGGAGNDSVVYDDYATSINVTGQDTTAGNRFTVQLLGANNTVIETDVLTNIERIVLGAGKNTVDLSALTSSAYGLTVDGSLGSSNSILGGSGNDSIVGGTGNDTLVSGYGNDSLEGGAGNDTVDFSYIVNNSTINATSSSYSSANGGTITLSATIKIGSGSQAVKTDRLTNIEAIKFGGSNNTVNLSAMTNPSYGLTIDGGLGSSDSILGGAGNDWLIGGTGSNTLNGGIGSNTIDGSLGTSNSLMGGTGSDSIIGGSAADTITDGGGSDTLVGGGGNDLYILSGGNDTIIETANGGIDTIQTTLTSVTLGLTDTSKGGSANNYVENLTYTGNANFTGVGNELNNLIIGGGPSTTPGIGNNSLSGGLGNDTLIGNTGAVNLVTGPANYLDPANWPGAWNGNGIVSNDTTTISPGGGFGLRFNTGYISSGMVIGARYVETFFVQNGLGGKLVISNRTSIPGDATIVLSTSTLASQVIIGNTYQSDDISITDVGGGWSRVTISGVATGGNNTGVNVYTDLSSPTLIFRSPSISLANSNTLDGGDGNDSLLGGYGNDSLIGGTGNDTIDGLSGSDTVSYAYVGVNNSLTTGLILQLNTTTAVQATVSAGVDIDTLVNIENVIGTKFNDSIAGDSRNNSISGGLGADTLSGGLGNDTLNGGGDSTTDANGNTIYLDWVDYSYVGDTNNGAAGGSNLTTGVTVNLTGTGGTATVLTGVDVDSLSGIENVKGSKFADSLSGDGMNNNFNGGLGSDTLSGGGGNDTLDGGGGGVDVVSYAYLTTSTIGVSLDLKNFNSSTAYTYSVGGSSTDVDVLSNFEGIIGGAGNDTLIGDDATNSLAGGGGNDSFSASLGNDTLDGGSGTNTVSYSLSGYWEALTGTDNAATITLSNGTTTYTQVLYNFKTITGLNIGNPTSTAGVTVNYSALPSSFSSTNLGLIGTDGADSIRTGGGNDTIQSRGGNDTIDGGAGSDIVDYSYVTTSDGITVTLQNSVLISTTPIAVTVGNTAVGNSKTDSLVNIEGIIGTKNADYITNNSAYAQGNLKAILGDVQLYGMDGNDTIQAANASGYQTLDGGDGIDLLDLSMVTYNGAVLDLSNTTSVQAINANGRANALVVNFENVLGSSAADSIIGTSNDNSINGAAGNDTIRGGPGYGTLDGGDGSDVADYSYVTDGTALSINLKSVTFNVVLATVGVSTSINYEIDRLINIEGLIGGSGNDTLVGGDTVANGAAGGYFDGGAGDDKITGGNGADTLRGGTGNDTLDGGTGTDMVDYGYITGGQTVSISVQNATTWSATVSGNDIDTLYNFEQIMGSQATGAALNLAVASTLSVNIRAYASMRGADTVTFGAGNDYLDYFGMNNGVSGNIDTADGGAGNDSLASNYNGSGGNGLLVMDQITANAPQSGKWTLPNYSYSGGGTTQSKFVNFEWFGFYQGTSYDTMVGTANNSKLYFSGGGGSDMLDDGGGTSMTLDGNSGADTYFLRSSSTRIIDYYQAGDASIDTVYTTLNSVDLSSTQMGGGNSLDNLTYLNATTSGYNGSGWDTITLGSGPFVGIGNNLNNVITGGTGNNSLVGGVGADTLIGNNGDDILVGGDATTLTSPNSTVLGSGAGLNGVNNVTATGPGSGYLLTNSTTGNTNNTAFTQWSYQTAANAAYQETFYIKAASTNAAKYVQVGMANGALLSWLNIDLTSKTSASGTFGSSATSNGPVVYLPGGFSGQSYSVTYDAVNQWYVVILTGTTLSSGSGYVNPYVALLDQNYNNFVFPATGYTQFYNNNTLALNLSASVWLGGLAPLDMGDLLIGGAGNDTIIGGAGNDTMDGGTGNDIASYAYLTTGVTLNLASFNSTTAQTVSISAGDVDSVMNFEGLIGGSGNDYLIGDNAANYLGGGAGNDTIQGGLGNDTLDGGAGTGDVADYSYLKTGSTGQVIGYDQANGRFTLSFSTGDIDVLTNIETIMLGAGNNTIDLSAINSSNLGLFIDGSAGTSNSIIGTSGNDTLMGGFGADTLVGGAGNDLLYGSDGADSLSGGTGDDTIQGSAGGDTLDGGTGTNTLDYSIANGAVAVNLATSSASKVSPLSSLTGIVDAYNFNQTGSVSNNGSLRANNLVGTDALTVYAPDTSGALTATFNTGQTGHGNAISFNNNGTYSNSTVAYASMKVDVSSSRTISFSFDQTMVNGSIPRFMSLASNSGLQLVQLMGSQAAGGLSLSTDTGGGGMSIGNYSLNSWSNIAISMTFSQNKITYQVYYNGALATLLNGQSSYTTAATYTASDLNNASLYFGKYYNVDRAYTGMLDDVVILDHAINNTEAQTLYQASSVGLGLNATDNISNFQNIIGSALNDTLTGDGNANVISGGAGNDTIDGGGGSDTLNGGSGFDMISFASANSGITVSLANSTMSGGGHNDTYFNFEGIIGSSYNDLLTGDSNANYLGGSGGDDTLLGGLGSDTLSGGTGNDSLDGNGTATVDGSSVDVVDYTYATAGVTLSVGNINSSTPYTFSVGGLSTDVDVLKNFEGIIGGSGNDSLTGDTHANYLSGGIGDDTLVGGGGADTLLGGTGNDTLKLDWSSISLSNLDGGAGNDTAVFTNSGTGSQSLSFTSASLTNVLVNTEYLDFSNVNGNGTRSTHNVSLTMDGAGIQTILTGAPSLSTNAGTLDLKLDIGHNDTLTIAANSNYTYSNVIGGVTTSLSGTTAIAVSTLDTTGGDILVYDATHMTLLADLHYHV